MYLGNTTQTQSGVRDERDFEYEIDITKINQQSNTETHTYHLLKTLLQSYLKTFLTQQLWLLEKIAHHDSGPATTNFWSIMGAHLLQDAKNENQGAIVHSGALNSPYPTCLS